MKRLNNKIYRTLCKPFRRSNPKLWADALYRDHFGRPINWQHPSEFNEKLRWLQFYSDTSIWSLLADKYRARDFVTSKGCGHLLVEHFGVFDAFESININALPNQFVIKTTHGCGDVILVQDKHSANWSQIHSQMNKALRRDFGYKLAETHYLSIPHRIVIEQLLPNSSSFSSTIVDYKFYCFHGNPIACVVILNRDYKHHSSFAQIFDMSWTVHDEWLKDKYRPSFALDIPKPTSFNEMVRCCRILGTDLPFVRIDFYESEGRPFFGEFTFTPDACGGSVFNNYTCQTMLANLLNIYQ